jgi:hypothetical protein
MPARPHPELSISLQAAVRLSGFGAYAVVNAVRKGELRSLAPREEPVRLLASDVKAWAERRAKTGNAGRRVVKSAVP